MNNAPFKIGDRVVCIKSHSARTIIKGQIFTVTHMDFECCGWNVGVGIQENDFNVMIRCGCGKHYYPRNSNYVPFSPRLFALIQPRHEDAAIDEAILEQARELIGVNETVAPVGEPVNN